MGNVQIFVYVDDQGNITEHYSGEKMVATENFDFYFFKSKEVADNIDNYKVELVGMKADLVFRGSK